MNRLSFILTPLLLFLLAFQAPSDGEIDKFMKNWNQSSNKQLASNSKEINRIRSQIKKQQIKLKGSLATNKAEQFIFKGRNEHAGQNIEVVVIALHNRGNIQSFLVETHHSGGESPQSQLSILEIESKKIKNGQPGSEIRMLNVQGKVIGGGQYAIKNNGQQLRGIYVGNLPFGRNIQVKAPVFGYVGPLPFSHNMDLNSCVAQVFPTLPAFVQRMCGASFDSCMNNNLLGCIGVIGCSFGYLSVCLHQNYGG